MTFFTKPIDEYTRDIDLLSAYEKDMATGLSATTGKSYEFCLEYVRRVTKSGGRLEYQDPPMKYVGKKNNGDRVVKVTTFLNYLKTVTTNNLIISPSLTVYKNKDMEESVTSIYIAGNVKKRSVSKKEMFAAREAGDKELFENKNNEQQSHKIKNNAMSGAHCSDSTILYLDTIHSTLTSTCRSASGYGNANNEKVISGNRHYWSPDIVTANITSIVNHVDFDLFDSVMKTYGIVAPTVDEVMACIEYSSESYWRDLKRMEIIRRLVSGLKPIELAAFMYTGDLYHLAKHNGPVVRKFLEMLAHRSEEPVENPKSYVDNLTDEMASMVSLLCGKYMDGKSISAYDDFTPDVQMILGSTAKHLTDTMVAYHPLIRAILVSDVMPSTLASLPTIMRRNAVTSDTDSTIFTVQDWLKWYSGSVSFDEQVVNIGHAVAFLTSASITHLLANMSSNMGVSKKQLFQYAMKSEFYFPVFTLTTRAKTYFAQIGAQEGQVLKTPDVEIKGAALKGSASPKFVVDGAKKLILEILDTVAEGKQIELFPILNRIAKVEKHIFDSIERGETDFYKRGEIKPADSYKLSESQSPYFQYLLWENVFANKYGHVDPPPYRTIKVNMDVGNATDYKAWLDSFEDPAIRDAFVETCLTHNKNRISTIYVPQSITDVGGIPKEIINGVSSRKIVSNLMEPYFIILEALGYFTLDNHNLRLLSDTYLEAAI